MFPSQSNLYNKATAAKPPRINIPKPPTFLLALPVNCSAFALVVTLAYTPLTAVYELFVPPIVVAYVSVVVEPYGQYLTVAAQDEMVYVVVTYTTVL
jgi:hypothetical protein